MRAVASDAPDDRLAESLEKLLGKRTANALAKLGLRTAGDLIRHYPRRWNEPGKLTDMSELSVGEHVTVMARIERTSVRAMRSRGGAMLNSSVTDGVHELTLTYFGKSTGSLRSREDKLRPGKVGLFSGVVKEYQGTRQLTNPDYVIMNEDATIDEEAMVLEEASRPVPIYPATAAMTSWKIWQAIKVIMGTLTEEDLPDPLPHYVRTRHKYETLLDTLRAVHQPYSIEEARRGLARLKFDEAFILQVELARRRAEAAELNAVARPALPAGRPGQPSLLADFDAQLPFELTVGQIEVGRQIAVDLARTHPMQRLLQGDVGSGKTVVALRAMLQVVDAGGQAALLAPTEVLAVQHAQSLRALLGPLAEAGLLGGAVHGTKVTLLTGSLPASVRKQAMLDAASGAAGIVVGTHALLGEKVQFAELGLVVVDEQHRFGVEQRDLLRSRAEVNPHQLVMTATPIPRTVAMTVFGHLVTSTLTEMPVGRAEITTHMVPTDKPNWTSRMWERVRQETDKGNRVYVVCPRIDPDPESDVAQDDSEALYGERDSAPAVRDQFGHAPQGVGQDGQDEQGGPDGPPRVPLRAVLEVFDELEQMPALAGVAKAMLHGRMSPAEKEQVMADFGSGETKILVATTVVEVGVDVPEATVMIVLNADRFGISQLHQLRGRVGRSDRASLCFLVSAAAPDSAAAERVKETASTTDGFKLAQFDLNRRREGDVLGAAQSGIGRSLRLLRVVRDERVLSRARVDAEELIQLDPTLEGHPTLQAALAEQLRDERAEFIDRA